MDVSASYWGWLQTSVSLESWGGCNITPNSRQHLKSGRPLRAGSPAVIKTDINPLLANHSGYEEPCHKCWLWVNLSCSVENACMQWTANTVDNSPQFQSPCTETNHTFGRNQKSLACLPVETKTMPKVGFFPVSAPWLKRNQNLVDLYNRWTMTDYLSDSYFALCSNFVVC